MTGFDITINDYIYIWRNWEALVFFQVGRLEWKSEFEFEFERECECGKLANFQGPR